MPVLPVQPPVRITLARTIAADPCSVALLLAAPAAVELWPGVRRVTGVDGTMTVVAELAPPAQAAFTTAVTLRTGPPRRTSAAYLLRFEVSGPGLPVVTGRLTLDHEHSGPHSATEARLDIDCLLPTEGPLGVLPTAQLLERSAEGFLGRLAGAAERRALAA
ncbi:MAG: hypothetical protein NVSMB13_13920 [Mycobacteriales bacterium]